jgi:ribosomal-protein-alanine N-acetyltransferase
MGKNDDAAGCRADYGAGIGSKSPVAVDAEGCGCGDARAGEGVQYILARRAHIPDIHEIEKLSFATPWSADAIEREFSDDLAHYIVALSGGAVVGYCGYWSIVGEAHITNVAVHPSHRRRHIGAGLMRSMIRDLISCGVYHATLEVREDNFPAIALYEQFGFVASGMRKNYYQKERKNAIIMWKHIHVPL